MTSLFNEYIDRKQLFDSLTDIVSQQLQNALQERNRITVAVPGGTTPAPFLKALSKRLLPWNRVNIILTDERIVPIHSNRSNARLLNETLLINHAASAHFLPLNIEPAMMTENLQHLRKSLHQLLPIDVCILGMGTDMHTASLFPNSDNLGEALNLESSEVLIPINADGIPETRLTLTANVLRQSQNLHLLITGEDKRQALEKAMNGNNWFEAPIRAVLTAPTPLNIHYTV